MATDISARSASPGGRVVVAIATPLEAELVASIEAVDERLQVLYQPELLPPPRFPCDHRGAESFRRTGEEEQRWQTLLTRAEVLFGLPGDSPDGLGEVVRASPALRWVQATADGAAEQVRAAGLTDAELARVMITRATGVHAGPLAEFAMFGVLTFTKGLPRLLTDQHARQWDHYPMGELRDATLLIVGLGAIGVEVARLAKAFGMRTIGVDRDGRTNSPDIDEIRPSRFLGDLLPVAHAVVLCLPLTDETRGMIDAQAFSRMRTGAVLVNVGRGAVVDEAALVEALELGNLAGAALDVFGTEPLPPQSPLWGLPNVLVSPHTAGLSVHENERIVGLFTENLRRYLRGDDLIGRVHATPSA